jgi:hypothetical protein
MEKVQSPGPCFACKKTLTWEEGVFGLPCEESKAWLTRAQSNALAEIWIERQSRRVAHCTRCPTYLMCRACKESGQVGPQPCLHPLYQAGEIRCKDCRKKRCKPERGHFGNDLTFTARFWWCDACAPQAKQEMAEFRRKQDNRVVNIEPTPTNDPPKQIIQVLRASDV